MVLFAFTSANAATTPTKFVKERVDKVISILKDPQYKPANMKEKQYDDLWSNVKSIFNYRAISQGAIARKWKKFSKKEKKEFTISFRKLLASTYIKTLQDKFAGEEIEFVKEVKIKKGKYIVKSLLLSEGSGKIPIDYSLKMGKKGNWFIYDIKVEGISLVKNFRTQFSKILRKKSPAELIQKMKKKVKKNEEKRKEEYRTGGN